MARLRGVGHVVSDADLKRTDRRMRWVFLVMMVMVAVIVRALDDTAAGLAWFTGVMLVVGWIGELVIARGLPTIRFRASDLEPRSMRSYLAVTARAAGVPVLVAMLLVATFLAVGVVWGLVSATDWWMLILAVPMYALMVGVLVWQLVLLSREDRVN